MSRILLIDDDTDMLRLTARWLTKAGYEVDTAASGEDAPGLISQNRPQLIILDYMMPKMDGPATLAAIRNDPSNTAVPVIFRTGKEDAAMDIPGDCRVVQKSGGKGALLTAVSDALSMT